MKHYKPTDANLHDALMFELLTCSGDLKVFRLNLKETVADVIRDYKAGFRDRSLTSHE